MHHEKGYPNSTTISLCQVFIYSKGNVVEIAYLFPQKTNLDNSHLPTLQYQSSQIHKSLPLRHLDDCAYNTDNTYTSFKGFPLAGIWQEKPQIMVITDIKQRTVIIQLVVRQRVVYYSQFVVTPTRSSPAVLK